MSNEPRCLFLASSADFERTFAAPLQERLASVVEVQRASADASPSLDGVQICVSWDDSPPVSARIDGLDLIVHCGLTPKRVFPALEIPSAWSDRPGQSDRPGPRAWDNAGLQRFSGGHWRTSTALGATTADGPRLAVVSEPLERAIAEKLLAVVVMATCSPDFGRRGTKTVGPSATVAAMQRDFYDISVGIVGWGGAAVALCRLLRGYEVGLLVHDPDITGQAGHEMGGRLVVDVGELARDVDVLVLLPYKNTERAAPGRELWSEVPFALPVVVQGQGLVDEAAFAEFRGTAFVGLAAGEDARLAEMPNVRYVPGLDGLLPNSLSRVGWRVVDVVHRHVAERSQ